MELKTFFFLGLYEPTSVVNGTELKTIFLGLYAPNSAFFLSFLFLTRKFYNTQG